MSAGFSLLVSVALAAVVAPWSGVGVAAAAPDERGDACEGQHLRFDRLGKTPQCVLVDGSSKIVALNIEEAYGVKNFSDTSVTVALRKRSRPGLEQSLYFEETIPPRGVLTLDVDRSRSHVVEARWGRPTRQVATGKDALVVDSSVSVKNARGGKYVTVDPFSGLASGTQIAAGDSYLDRLDASFVVKPGLSDPGCFTFEMAAYPGAMLSYNDGVVKAEDNPRPQDATWCVEYREDGTALLRHAGNKQRALAQQRHFGVFGTFVAVTVPNQDSWWVIEEGLARR